MICPTPFSGCGKRRDDSEFVMHILYVVYKSP